MCRHLTTVPDFARTAARFEAWWNFELLDRPLLTMTAPTGRPFRGPSSTHASFRDRWFDANFALENFIASLDTTAYLGDAFPIFNPNLGPELTATLLGCELEFSEFSSWSRPIVHSPDDWDRILTQPARFDNVYWQTIEKLMRRAIDASQEKFLVGMTDLHGSYDILAALRDPQELCMDVLDCPDTLRRAGRHAAAIFVQSFERSWAILRDASLGSTCWTPFFHDGPAYVSSCDFWCMVSPNVARGLIWPDVQHEINAMQRSIFHLDGPSALPHLDLLLNCPNLQAVQWVYGDGHGPATNWIDVYRRIVAAGKSAQVICADAAEAMQVLEAVGPRGLWFTIHRPFASVAAARDFEQAVLRFTQSRTAARLSR